MHYLLLNTAKTGLLVVGTGKYGHLFENLSVNIDGCTVSKSLTTRNLDF